ncbi:hypothetical protein DIPPA_17320 [Diplonema papillatum]|nr:hypothetical protein DIPPA_17320 [Diplonema papillatum]
MDALGSVVDRTAKNIAVFRDGWGDLSKRENPRYHRSLIIAAFFEVLFVGSSALYAILAYEYDRYSIFIWLSTLISVLTLFLFACDSVYNENTVLLLVFNGISLFLTIRLWYIFATEILDGHASDRSVELAVLFVVTMAEIAFLAVSRGVANDFGRHVFFRVGAKMRIVRLYKVFQWWTALLKADVQASLVLLVTACFYFELPRPARVLLGVGYVAWLLLCVIAVRWMEREDLPKACFFWLVCLISPVLSVTAVVTLDDDWQQLRMDYIEHKFGGMEGNWTDESAGTALVLLNISVGSCILVRFAMMSVAILVMQGFGQGLYQALNRLEHPISAQVMHDGFKVFDEGESGTQMSQVKCCALCDDRCRLSGHYKFQNPNPRDHNPFDYHARRSTDPLEDDIGYFSNHHRVGESRTLLQPPPLCDTLGRKHGRGQSPVAAYNTAVLSDPLADDFYIHREEPGGDRCASSGSEEGRANGASGADDGEAGETDESSPSDTSSEPAERPRASQERPAFVSAPMRSQVIPL